MQRIERIGVADGSVRNGAPSDRGRGYVGDSCWSREGCAQRMGRIGVADGSERDTDGAGWGGGWVGAEQRALTSGAGAPLFGEIDTYGWDGSRLIRKN